MFGNILIICLLLIYSAIGVKLPGNCPKVQDSHTIQTASVVFYQFFFGISFAEQPTYLFINATGVHAQGLRIMVEVIDNGLCEIQLYNLAQTNRESRSYSAANFNFHIKLGSLTVESKILDQIEGSQNMDLDKFEPSQCYKPIKEVVRLWFEDPFIIIWSCVNSTIYNEHDEAIILGGPVPANVSDLVKMTDQSKAFAKKLIGKDLFDVIDWRMDLLNNGTDYNPFACPTSTQNIIIIIFVTIFILCLLFLAVFVF